MIIESDSASRLYWGRFYTAEPTITLDGEPYTHDYIIAVDDEAGEITVAVMNGSQPIFANGRYITEVVKGDVQIVGELRQR